MKTDKSITLSEKIISARQNKNNGEAVLVAISGIDASGKSITTSRIYYDLTSKGLKVAVISADKWLMHSHKKAADETTPSQFYMNSYRWNELFKEVLLPLKQNRSLYLEKELQHSTSDRPYLQVYRYSDIDVILFEGIFLFRHDYRNHYDLSIWVDCDFNTAFKRAMLRNQEQLTLTELIRDYKTIYFPAQHIHLDKDHPKEYADVVYINSNYKIEESISF